MGYPTTVVSEAFSARPTGRPLALPCVRLRRRPGVGGYTANDVEDRLEQAGRTLLALPWAGCFPAGLTCLWPEAGGGEARRYALPTAWAITEMDEAYRWIGLISDPDPDRLTMMRRLVLMRSLVIPDSPETQPGYRHKWSSLAQLFGLHRETLKTRWGRGIDLIVARLNSNGQGQTAGVRRKSLAGPPSDH